MRGLKLTVATKVLMLWVLSAVVFATATIFATREAVIAGSTEVTANHLQTVADRIAARVDGAPDDEWSAVLTDEKQGDPSIEKITISDGTRILAASDADDGGNAVGEGDPDRGAAIAAAIDEGEPQWRIEGRTDIVPRLTYVAPMSLGDTPHTIVFKYAMEREFHAIEHATGRVVLVVILVVSLGTPLMTLFVNRMVRRPLRLLAAGAHHLASGRFGAEPEIRSRDELGDLSRSFREMASQIRATYERYLSPQVVQSISDNPDLLSFGGRRAHATVLFADLASFTSLSSRVSVEAISAFLNQYFEAMTEITFAHGGTLDKYIGDGILAVFSAPLELPDHEQHAFEAAVEMVRVLRENAAAWLAKAGIEGSEPVSIRVGLASGELFSGHVGYSRRTDFTVIGPAVNLASRLEAMNKELGTDVLMDGETYRAVGAQEFAHIASAPPSPAGTATAVRGLEAPVAVWGVAVG